jgi:cytochrome c biogenesis protein CcmG/thiol:disulfide interchange protein DsbE
MTRRRSFLHLLVLGLCFIGTISLSGCAREKEPYPVAPDFSVKTLDGQQITLSQLRGQVVLLDFWATWCSPCRESMPHLVDLYNTYRAQGLEVIGLSEDKGDVETVRHFVKSLDIPYPIAICPDEVSRSFRVSALPTAFLIDRNGKIQQKILGFNPSIAQQVKIKIGELTAQKSR